MLGMCLPIVFPDNHWCRPSVSHQYSLLVSCVLSSCTNVQRRRKDFLIGGAQSETTHRVVSNLYNNLWDMGGHMPPAPPWFLRLWCSGQEQLLRDCRLCLYCLYIVLFILCLLCFWIRIQLIWNVWYGILFPVSAVTTILPLCCTNRKKGLSLGWTYSGLFHEWSKNSCIWTKHIWYL